MFEFPLTVEKLDDVPQEFRPCYEDKDGKISLIKPLATAFIDRKSLNEVVDKERKRTKNAEAALAPWRELAETPEALKAKLEADTADLHKKVVDMQKIIDEKGDGAKQFEKWKTETLAETKKLVDAASGRASKAESALQRHMIEGTATAAIAAAKGNVKVLLPHVTRHCKIAEENGDYVLRVIDEDGDVRLNSSGKALSVAELVEDFRKSDDFAGVFEVPEQSGSGTPPKQQGSGRGIQTFGKKEWQDKVMSAKPEERTKLVKDYEAGRIRVNTV